MSCAFVSALRVMALPLSSERLGVGRPIISATVFGYACEFDPVCDGEHIEERGGAVEQDALKNALVQQQEEMGADIEWAKLVDFFPHGIGHTKGTLK